MWHICDVSDMDKSWIWSEYELYIATFSTIINKNTMYTFKVH